jgi:hypothetical protein
MEVESNGNDWNPIVKPQDGVVLEHTSRKIGLRLPLNLHVDQNQSFIPFSSLKSCHDVGLPHVSVGNVREKLFVKEAKRLEIKLSRHIRKEQLEELLEQPLENGFE